MLQNLQSMLGGRVFYHSASLGKFLIIFGGYDNFSSTYYNDLLSLNTISGVLKRCQPPIEMSHSLYFSKICIGGNKVYMFCQEQTHEDIPKNNLIYSFDVVNARWQTFCPNTEHNAHNGSPLLLVNLFFYHNESLYILGTDRQIYISEHEEHLEDVDNSGDENRNVIYKLCMKTFIWSLVKQIGQTPIFYGQIYSTVFKNKLYIFDTSVSATIKVRKVDIFDLCTNKWTTRAITSKNLEYPHYRTRETYAFSSTCAFMSGGSNPGIPTCYHDIWRMDLNSLEWIKMDYVIGTLANHVELSVVDDAYLYSFGMLFRGSPFINTLERFTVQPLSLYRLCLETVYRLPNMRSYIRSLPAAIVDELHLNDNDKSTDA